MAHSPAKSSPGDFGCVRVGLLDLFFWSVASGRADMAATLWRRCPDPTRAALVASDMCVRIRRLHAHRLAVSQTREKLRRIEAECNEAVTGVLDNVRDSVSARSILLSQYSTLGVKGDRPANLLELGIHLHSENFISHAWNQAILDEQWCGRDSRCGKVMLRRLPESTTVLLLQTVLNLLGVQLLDLQANPDYPWHRPNLADTAGSADAPGAAAPNKESSCAAPQLRARRGSRSDDWARQELSAIRGRIRGWAHQERTELATKGEQDVAVYEQLLHFYRIPAVKHMATLITTTLRYLLFVKVPRAGGAPCRAYSNAYANVRVPCSATVPCYFAMSPCDLTRWLSTTPWRRSGLPWRRCGCSACGYSARSSRNCRSSSAWGRWAGGLYGVTASTQSCSPRSWGRSCCACTWACATTPASTRAWTARWRSACVAAS